MKKPLSLKEIKPTQESFVGTWVLLGTITFSEINQTHELKFHVLSLIQETQSINKDV